MRYPKQSGIFLAVTPGNRENPLSVFTYLTSINMCSFEVAQSPFFSFC